MVLVGRLYTVDALPVSLCNALMTVCSAEVVLRKTGYWIFDRGGTLHASIALHLSSFRLRLRCLPGGKRLWSSSRRRDMSESCCFSLADVDFSMLCIFPLSGSGFDVSPVVTGYDQAVVAERCQGDVFLDWAGVDLSLEFIRDFSNCSKFRPNCCLLKITCCQYHIAIWFALSESSKHYVNNHVTKSSTCRSYNHLKHIFYVREHLRARPQAGPLSCFFLMVTRREPPCPRSWKFASECDSIDNWSC